MKVKPTYTPLKVTVEGCKIVFGYVRTKGAQYCHRATLSKRLGESCETCFDSLDELKASVGNGVEVVHLFLNKQINELE